MKTIPGYDGGPLDDGGALLGAAAFWPAHLGPHLMDPMEDVAALFGIPFDEVEAAYRRLTDHAAWPVFTFDTGRDARLAVVYRNLDEDEGVDYLLVPDGADAITVATDEGGAFGRGLTWDEVAALAARQPEPIIGARLLLLLAPMIVHFEAPDSDVVARLADALRTAGVPGPAQPIAERILHPDDYSDDDEPAAFVRGDTLADRILAPVRSASSR
ncbi:hypothetical protein FHR83_006342 [Actinoplanes campanulatus]|uniref:Uncharacterized protein n=1 Tax=Actinoplanes campanulatus TaxID=113559 RepID=A0A7W5ALU6_9ACTN|nr:hypothetical protein [Actinoplanes campanulatus]MBB3098643.1 hypothetical protein [Actinoplanes campanulatus]GGN36281.1 hypothetical protein GCM10010109_61100 [Actinoplanes campanulatus]GID39333.1 hypothetical protein Aca09nite_58390 [Actinoplanes campanulatus]